MKPGDIVRTRRDLDWIDDHCRAGTRLRLIRVRHTSNGPRWSAIEKDGATHHNIPQEDIEWLA